MTTFHGTYGLGPWGIKKAYNKVMTFGERMIAISNHIKQHVLKNYKISEDKITLIHRCADIERFSPEAVTQERMINKIKEYNIAEDKPVLLLPGRVTRWKGQHLLIEALHLMKHKNYYCIITGDAQGRQKYLDYLEKLTVKYKLKNRVGFFWPLQRRSRADDGIQRHFVNGNRAGGFRSDFGRGTGYGKNRGRLKHRRFA